MNNERISVAPLLHDIINSLEWDDIAEEYFHENADIFFRRLLGREKDTDPKKGFSTEEVQILKGALVELAHRIRTAADKL